MSSSVSLASKGQMCSDSQVWSSIGVAAQEGHGRVGVCVVEGGQDGLAGPVDDHIGEGVHIRADGIEPVALDEHVHHFAPQAYFLDQNTH